VRQWLTAGRVRVNGAVARDGRQPVADADVVELSGERRPPFPTALRRVYEDDHLVVVDKPPGLLTIATERERFRTAYRLLWDYLAAATRGGRPFVVHRLDRDTSGLLVVAKSPAVKDALQDQFRARRVERIYVAVVEGRVAAGTGMLVGLVDGREALTRYRVLERRRDATLLELSLGTGRRHQIRLQLAELGHPIVGDQLHGRRRGPIGRLCLHATRLGFVHPVTGAPLRFVSAPPATFRRVGGAGMRPR
jgi:23S rRNA pseudouridine1911/1915/1917 synthase